MKRSEINKIIQDAKIFMAGKQFILPPWAYWSIDDWKKNKDNAEEILSNMLGWDITDSGQAGFSGRI
jgi:D-lyxose ketol-isomerase